MDTNTQIERLIELAIVQRTELKRLVEELPQLKEHLSAEIERTFEETEPQLRAELEEWTSKQAADKTAALGVALESKIASLAKSLEESAQAKFSAVLAARDQNADLLKQAEERIAVAASEIPSKVKEIVTAELARFPRAGEIDRLRKEFQEPRGLNPRGKWLPDQTYNKLDLVTWNGDSYVSNTDGNKERPGRNAANWTLSAARGTSGGGPADLSALTAVPSNGALLIGSGTSWVNGQLTAGAGVSITVGPGAITISATDGDITLDDGTAASPSLHFTNDADTGIYRPAANTLGISVSGTQVAYFDENGLTVPSAGVVAGGSIHASNGNANNPSLSFSSDQDTGFFRHQPNEIGIALGGTQYATLTSTTFSITPVVTMASSLRVNGTTDSSNKDTGAIVTEGGLGVEKSATIGGNLTVSGVTTSAGISNSGALTFTTAAAQGVGSIAKNATYGLTYYGVTGSSYDFALLNKDGNLVISNPTGTQNTTLAGNLTVSGTGTSSFAGLVKATGNAATSFGVEIANGAGSAGTAQYYLTAGNGAGFTAFRFLRGNGAAGYEDNSFNADCFTGARFNLNALGGSGGNFTISGGNLIVSGTGTSSVAGSLGIATTTPNKSSFSNAVTVNGAVNSGFEVAVGDTRIAGLYAASTVAVLNAFANVPLAFSTNNTTQMQLFANGNLFVGASPVDSANGKVQLATHTTSAGGIGFGTDTSLYRQAAGTLILSTGSYASQIASVSAGFYIGAATAGMPTVLTSGGGSPALTLDSSQNTILAGLAVLNQANSIRWTNNGTVGGTKRAEITADSSYLTIDSQTSNPIRLQTNSTTAVTIDSSQQVLTASNLAVGGTATSQRLHVNVDVYGASKSGGMRIGNSGNNYYSDLLVTTDGSSNPFVKLSFATHQLFQYAYGGGGNSWTFYTNNTTALTLDSSQNATFAGRAAINGAYATVATGNFTLSLGNFSAGTRANAGLRTDSVGDLDISAGSGGQLSLNFDTSVPVACFGNFSIATGKTLKLGNAYTASAVVPTGYVTIQDSTGTTYKVCVLL